MQETFSIFLPAVIGLVVLFVFVLLHFDRADRDSKNLDPSQEPAESLPGPKPTPPER